MYSGSRDPEIRIAVLQEHCYEYYAQNSNLFIEIYIPPENHKDYNQKWGSIMVKPTQVYYIPNTNCNLFVLNDGATIVNSVKNNTHTQVINMEILTPNQIIGRELKYHDYIAQNYKYKQIYKPEVHSNQHFQEYIQTRTYMYDYILNMYQ